MVNDKVHLGKKINHEGLEYVLEEHVGEGFMGEVYKGVANRNGVDHVSAFKVPKARKFNDYWGKAADIMETIQDKGGHENIVEYQGRGVFDQNKPYIKMEFLEGSDLGTHVANMHSKGEVSHAHTFSIVHQIMDALEFAHGVGVLHTDLKPDNIAVHKGRVKLMDFGLVQILKDLDLDGCKADSQGGYDYGATTEKPIQMMLNKSEFVPPEAWEGIFGDFTDVYALGKLLYFCATGQGVSHSGISERLLGENLATLQSVIRKSIDDHQHRYQSVDSFRSELDHRVETKFLSILTESYDALKGAIKNARTVKGLGITNYSDIRGIADAHHKFTGTREKLRGLLGEHETKYVQDVQASIAGLVKRDLKVIVNSTARKSMSPAQKKQAKALSKAWQDYDVDGFSSVIANTEYKTGGDVYVFERHEDADFFVRQGDKWFNKRNWDKVIEHLTKAIDMGRTDVPILEKRAIAHLILEDYDSSIADYSEVLKKDSKRKSARKNRAKAFIQNGNLESALQDAIELVNIEPNSAESYSFRAQTYLEMKKLEKALEDSTRAVRLAPDNPEALVTKAKSHRLLTEYPLAIRDCETAIAADPKCWQAYTELAKATIDSNQSKHRAMKILTDGIRQVDHVDLYSMRAELYFSIGRFKHAQKDASKAIKLAGGTLFTPGRVEDHLTRGNSCMNLKNYKDAAYDFSQAIKASQPTIVLYELRAEAHTKAKMYEEAIKDYDVLYNHSKKHGRDEWWQYLYNRGDVYLELGKQNEAIRDFQEAIQQKPDSAVAGTYRRKIATLRAEA